MTKMQMWVGLADRSVKEARLLPQDEVNIASREGHIAFGFVTPTMQARRVGTPLDLFRRLWVFMEDGRWCEITSGCVRESDDYSKIVWLDGSPIEVEDKET